MSISDFFSTMRNDGQRLNREEANLIAEDQRAMHRELAQLFSARVS